MSLSSDSWVEENQTWYACLLTVNRWIFFFSFWPLSPFCVSPFRSVSPQNILSSKVLPDFNQIYTGNCRFVLSRCCWIVFRFLFHIFFFLFLPFCYSLITNKLRGMGSDLASMVIVRHYKRQSREFILPPLPPGAPHILLQLLR